MMALTMSNHAFRRKNRQAKPLSIKEILASGLVGLLLVFSIWALLSKLAPEMRHTTGHILQTRTSIVGLQSSNHSGNIFYRAEAQVAYTADGRDYVEWLPATKATTDKAWLDLELSRRADDAADVSWKSDPKTASAALHYR